MGVMQPNVFLFYQPPLLTSTVDNFSPEQKVLWNLLKHGNPIPISVLFEALNRTPGVYSLREQQQRVGAPVSYMNKLLFFDGMRIVPGEPRGTYKARWTT